MVACLIDRPCTDSCSNDRPGTDSRHRLITTISATTIRRSVVMFKATQSGLKEVPTRTIMSNENPFRIVIRVAPNELISPQRRSKNMKIVSSEEIANVHGTREAEGVLVVFD